MADQQRVIEFLRDVRQGVGGGGLQHVTEEIAQMAAEYAAMCERANERLRKCSGFLQQGLRTEAIHLAEEQPNLLDLVSQLDLPDPQAWVEFCQNNSLPVPPPLQLERAAQLNEAYAQDQPLEHLLSRHRLLALSRAPVRERLDVMRKIVQTDAGNASWEKDIRIFEKSRLKELPAAFYNAMKNHDTRALVALNDELNNEPWFEPPPADLTSAVAEAHARLQRHALETELRKLVEPMREAYAARSLQECQALVQRWKHLMNNAGINALAAELMDELKPVQNFIAEQTKRDELMKRFNDSCRAFSKMLDADSSDAQLEAGYAKLREFKEEIPEDLTKRYMGKKAGRRKDTDRKHKVRLVFIGGVFLGLISIGLLVVWLFFHASTADKWAKKISDATGQHSKAGLDEAAADINKLTADNAGLLSEPKVAAAINEYKAQQAKYDADAGRVPPMLKKLEGAGQAATALLGKADATMEEIRAAAVTLDAAVSEANTAVKDVAWADPDGKLKGAMGVGQSVRKSLGERVAAAVRKEMEAISAALTAIPENPASQALATQAQRELQDLADRTAALRNFPLLEPATLTSVDALLASLAQRRQGANMSGNVAGELENIRTRATSAAALRAALDSFIQKFPNDAHTIDFMTALQALKPAETLEAWQAQAGAYKGAFAPTGLQDAQRKLDAISKFNTDHPENPKSAEAAQYADYLRRAVDALGDKGPWQTALADYLLSPMMTDVAIMEVSDGRRFYTLGDIKRVERKMMSQTSVQFESIDPTDTNKRITNTIDPPLSVAGPTPAPHTKVIADLADSLKVIDEKNWDTYGIDLSDKLLKNDAIDPIVRAALLQVLLKTESEVSPAVADSYEKTLTDLSRQNPAQLTWWDPTRISDGTRKAIKATTDAIPPAASVKQKLAAARTAIFNAALLDSPTAGVLLKDDAGAWAIYSKGAPITGAAVYAILGTKSPAGAGLAKVAVAADGKFVFDDAALRGLPQGNIVYVVHE